MLLVTLFALSCSAAAPFTREQTNEQQPLSENASASFTPLTPLNIFGSTAVFPPMFQLGSGAGGDPAATRSPVSPDPRPDTLEPSVIQTTKNDRRLFLQPLHEAGRLPTHPSAARRLQSSSTDGGGRTTIPEKLSALLSHLTSPFLPDQSRLLILLAF